MPPQALGITAAQKRRRGRFEPEPCNLFLGQPAPRRQQMRFVRGCQRQHGEQQRVGLVYLLRGSAGVLLRLYPDAVIYPWPGCIPPQRLAYLAVGIGIAGAVIAGIQCQHTTRRTAAVAAPDIFVGVDVEPPALIPAKGTVQVQARRQTTADGKTQQFYYIGNAKRKRIGR